jgi:hypothetical protein
MPDKSTEAGEGLRGRLSARGEEALGEVAQALLDTPVFRQMLDAAFGARDAASNATAQAMKNLNLPTASEVDRLERRLRGLSERLEAVEDRLDEIANQVAALSRRSEDRS